MAKYNNRYDFKPLTEISWIVSHGGNRLGMAYKKQDDTYQLLGFKGLSKNTFGSIEDLEQNLNGEIVFEEMINDSLLTDEVGDIEGYPIKHDACFDIISGAQPSYRKKESSGIRFAAGYYALLFNTGWVGSLCPKVVTLQQNQHLGPFKNKLEMNHAIKCENNKPSEI